VSPLIITFTLITTLDILFLTFLSMKRLTGRDRCFIREECRVKENVMTKIEKNMLRWFAHVERMDKKIDKTINEAEWMVLEGETRNLGEHFLT
jgi:hypothetical protein